MDVEELAEEYSGKDESNSSNSSQKLPSYYLATSGESNMLQRSVSQHNRVPNVLNVTNVHALTGSMQK